MFHDICHPQPSVTQIHSFLVFLWEKISIFVISSGLFSANVCTALLTNDIAHSRPFTKSSHNIPKKVLLYAVFIIVEVICQIDHTLTLLWSYPSYLKCFLDTLCPHNDSADLHASSGNSITNESGHFSQQPLEFLQQHCLFY